MQKRRKQHRENERGTSERVKERSHTARHNATIKIIYVDIFIQSAIFVR